MELASCLGHYRSNVVSNVHTTCGNPKIAEFFRIFCHIRNLEAPPILNSEGFGGIYAFSRADDRKAAEGCH